MIRLLRIVLVISLFGLTATAGAHTIRISLPDLLGPQTIDSLEPHYVCPLCRSASVLVNSLPIDSQFVGFEWSGTIKPGRVVGDGAIREPIEQILKGTFSIGLTAPSFGYVFFPASVLPASGPFQDSWQWPGGPVGGFIDHNCLDCTYPPNEWTVGLQLAPDYFALGDSIPFLQPPSQGELRVANQGLILLDPIYADVTSAALIFEMVPEPSVAMLAVMAIAILANTDPRRRRKAS